MEGAPPGDFNAAPETIGVADRRIARWLGVCALLLYLPFFHGHFFGTDETSAFEVTRSLYRDGTFEVKWEAPYHVEGRDGRTYSHFAVGQSVLALPFYALGRAIRSVSSPSALELLNGRRQSGGKIDTIGGPEVFAVALYGPVATAVLVGLFFLFERRLGVSARSAALAAALLCSCTYVAMMSVYFLRHTTEALTVLGALYCLYKWKQGGPLRCLAWGSGLAAATILVRVPAAIVLPAIAGYVGWLLWTRSRQGTADLARSLMAAALPALAVVAVHVGTNWLRWGSFIGSPMLDQAHLLSNPLHVGLFGFLLSPGCSIFLYSPLLLLLPSTSRVLWAQHRDECAVLIAISLCLLLFCSSFVLWTGLWSSPGPRYLFLLTPLCMLALGPWLDTRPGLRARWVVALLALAGGFVQIVLMSSRWSAVIALMDYKPFAPMMDFVFLPDRSPIEGSWLALQAGHVDAWLHGVWYGWPGNPGAPAVAAILLSVWIACVVVSVRSLRRSLAAAR